MSRLAAAAVTGAAIAMTATGSGQAILAQVDGPFDEASALLSDELNTIEVIDLYGPSVVAITVAVRGQATGPFEGAPDDEVPEDFERFERFFGDRVPVRQSAGSGFLIESEGQPYLVTNFHVVEGALEPGTADAVDEAVITVAFPADADEDVPVDVVGVNPSFDLALLQLQDDAQLPPATPLAIADSSDLRVGQKTIAIGNPFGLQSSVTSGIVSALGRFVPTIGGLPVPMIQTDAAINPGNSGGPLLDSSGRLIGINTALVNPLGRSFAGLGFAVPSDLLTESLANLELGGVTDVSSTRPRLGIAAQSLELLPIPVRDELQLPDAGVAILGVEAGSAADKAGLQGTQDTIVLDEAFEFPAPHDIIVAIDGEAVDSVEDVAMKVTYESAAGDELDFSVIRDGVEISVLVRLEVSPAPSAATPR
jgi:S1-C subfamily serine protease